ncbi:TrkA family potassium uptake protein [Acidaminobacter sp. JC074]|uniref:potassium channel family protein n=1 Tax=Acidaminobacter sp. JC074 TaxID=2530199 RepID=UPI001F115B2D|nr:NAD-binding protein [Acidaminobacter sp. JC074]MCH4888891.1 TrkA family potassium uptake protein [Acidaminobacter sp. JC074]
MNILIAGGGIVGRNITKALSKDHNVIVIERDQALCEKIYSKYGAVAIQGDATNINILREAGMDKVDIALGVMSYDSENLLFSLLCKNFGIKNIFVRMRDPEYRDAYEIAGATNIGSAVDMLTKKFILDIQNPEIRRVASLRNGKAEVSIVTLPDHSGMKNKQIKDIASHKDFPDDCVIAGIFNAEEDKFIVPRGNTNIEAKNQLFLVGTRDSVTKAYKVLSKK